VCFHTNSGGTCHCGDKVLDLVDLLRLSNLYVALMGCNSRGCQLDGWTIGVWTTLSVAHISILVFVIS
jgi:hypothetical protein